MSEQKEIRAKSLEIAALILGGFSDTSLDKYLPLAKEIEEYIKGPPSIATVDRAETTGT
jgi:hypothetical protein